MRPVSALLQITVVSPQRKPAARLQTKISRALAINAHNFHSPALMRTCAGNVRDPARRISKRPKKIGRHGRNVSDV